MMGGGLPTAFATGVGCCWVQGSGSALYAGVGTESTSTIILGGAKQLRVGITHEYVAIGLLNLLDQLCFFGRTWTTFFLRVGPLPSSLFLEFAPIKGC